MFGAGGGRARCEEGLYSCAKGYALYICSFYYGENESQSKKGQEVKASRRGTESGLFFCSFVLFFKGGLKSHKGLQTEQDARFLICSALIWKSHCSLHTSPQNHDILTKTRWGASRRTVAGQSRSGWPIVCSSLRADPETCVWADAWVLCYWVAAGVAVSRGGSGHWLSVNPHGLD